MILRCVRCHKSFKSTGTKKCNECRALDKIWRAQNKERLAARAKEYYKTHRNEYLQRAKDNYDPEKAKIKYQQNREKQIERAKKWKKENPERAREINRRWKKNHQEKRREEHKQYTKRHPEKRKAHKQKRRALKANADGSFSGDDLNELFKLQNGCCHYCEKPLYSTWNGERAPYDIEHKTPLSRGGTNYIENIALTCPECNQNKGSMTEEEFKELLPVVQSSYQSMNDVIYIIRNNHDI